MHFRILKRWLFRVGWRLGFDEELLERLGRQILAVQRDDGAQAPSGSSTFFTSILKLIALMIPSPNFS